MCYGMQRFTTGLSQEIHDVRGDNQSLQRTTVEFLWKRISKHEIDHCVFQIGKENNRSTDVSGSPSETVQCCQKNCTWCTSSKTNFMTFNLFHFVIRFPHLDPLAALLLILSQGSHQAATLEVTSCKTSLSLADVGSPSNLPIIWIKPPWEDSEGMAAESPGSSARLNRLSFSKRACCPTICWNLKRSWMGVVYFGMANPNNPYITLFYRLIATNPAFPSSNASSRVLLSASAPANRRTHLVEKAWTQNRSGYDSVNRSKWPWCTEKAGNQHAHVALPGL